MKRTTILLFTLVFSGVCRHAFSQSPVIPRPSVVSAQGGYFPLSAQTGMHLSDPGLLPQADFFNAIFKKLSGFALQTTTGKNIPPHAIQLRLTKEAGVSGSYSIISQSTRIVVSANSQAGILYGLSSLLQSVQWQNGQPALPLLNIGDAPAFEYRGLMLDVSRHFRSVDYIKQLLDQMALLKMNVFHWHLTDDQGWRIEIKKYPLLTQVGAWRDGTIMGGYPGTGNDNLRHGGFYSQEEVKEIVAYAARRSITVVPEIEMPGHSSAAIAAYPWLSCFPEEETVIPKHPSAASIARKGKKVQESWGVYEDVFIPSEKTFAFLQDVIDEIVPLFPGKYIHIGGDECPKESWKRSAFCQQLIREKDLKDEHGLQSYFIRRMEKYINQKGKQIIGWDEILEGGLAPNATVMSWRGEAGGIEAAKQRHDVIMTPTTYAYLDYSQTKNEDSVVIGGYLPLEKVYSFNPIPEILEGTEAAQYIKGAQGNVWTEYMRSNEKVDYMVFPRIAAIAEAAWTQAALKSWPDFEKRMPDYLNLLDKLGINYSKSFYEIKAQLKADNTHSGIQWILESKLPGAVIEYQAPGMEKPVAYEGPVRLTESGTYAAFTWLNGRQVHTIRQVFKAHKAVGRALSMKIIPSAKYPGNGGYEGMVNGAISQNGRQSPEWLGWEGTDAHFVIDLGTAAPLREIVIHSLQMPGAWIYFPGAVEINLLNEDGSLFQGIEQQLFWEAKDAPQQSIVLSLPEKAAGRYIDIKLKNHGTIATGKPGAGNKAWLFIDEIEVH